MLLYSRTYSTDIFNKYLAMVKDTRHFLFSFSNNIFTDKMNEIQNAADNVIYVHGTGIMHLSLKILKMKEVPFVQDEIETPLPEELINAHLTHDSKITSLLPANYQEDMNIKLDCIPCIVNNFLKLLKTGVLPENAREPAMRRLLVFLAEADFQQSPPVLGREIHRMIREELNNPDPYSEIKNEYNRKVLGMYPDLEKMVMAADDSFDTAMRLAIAGNVIDFGSQHQFDLMDTLNRVISANIAIDDSQKLKEDLKSAKSLLYIGDNCGEIVFDKLFITHINVPDTYFAVRGGPVINDITMDDALLVGMDKLTKIITTGDNAPGAVWESTSDEFKQVFNEADVIISKGQGNLEGLIDVPGNIYFLFVSKCNLIAIRLGAKNGDFIVKHGLSRIEQKY